MSKIKTHKATAKRIVVTKKNKIKHRKCGQDHFNARDTGNAVRKKRRDITISKTVQRTIKRLISPSL